MARKRANLTDLLNDLTFNTLYRKFQLISMTAFKWEGLPEGIQERHIERELFDHGLALFFRDPHMSYMVLEGQSTGKVNVYGDPVSYIAHGFNYHKTFRAEKCVVIENNMLRIATRDFVMMYVNKLYEAERTMDVNVKSVKTPVIIKCDDKDVLTFKTIFQKVDGNVPAIYADRNLSIDSISTLDLQAKFLGNELMDYKRSVENELLTFLGVNNTPVDKKERLITEEATANNELIAAFFELQYEARKRACEAINEMFGLSVSVKPRQTVETTVENGENPDGEEVEE